MFIWRLFPGTVACGRAGECSVVNSHDIPNPQPIVNITKIRYPEIQLSYFLLIICVYSFAVTIIVYLGLNLLQS